MYSRGSGGPTELPPGHQQQHEDSSSVDEMDTSSGGGGGGGGFEAKGWGPAEEDEEGRDREFFENGEYLPSRIDTTQHSYNAVVSA